MVKEDTRSFRLQLTWEQLLRVEGLESRVIAFVLGLRFGGHHGSFKGDRGNIGCTWVLGLWGFRGLACEDVLETLVGFMGKLGG